MIGAFICFKVWRSVGLFSTQRGAMTCTAQYKITSCENSTARNIQSNIHYAHFMFEYDTPRPIMFQTGRRHAYENLLARGPPSVQFCSVMIAQ